MICEVQVFHDNLLAFIGDDPSGGRQVAGSDTDVGVGETLHIGQRAVRR